MVEDRELWIQFKKIGNLEIREKIILKYIPLVKYVVGKMISNLPKTVEYDDLVEYGIIGLLDAINKYDITKEINFKTYAITRVKGSIYDELRVQDWVPRSVRKLAKEIEAAYVAIEENKKRAATEQEVADFLEISLSRLNEIMAKISLGNISSLDDIIYENGSSKTTLTSTVEDKNFEDAQTNLEKIEIKKVLIERLKELKEKERIVISLYYYESLTLKEIGKVLEISESRVSQIHSKAVMKLRSKFITNFKDYDSIF